MPTKYTGRVLLILFVLFAALWAIFPNPLQLFNPHIPFAQKNALRPGIDMVGGTSLLYEIKASEGSTADAHLAERVMEALKKRVDPQGVRNLIWRPQGATRLEIQMPLSGRTGDSKQKRESFYTAEGQLDATNVRLNQVTAAVENLKGPDREQALNGLAMGSGARRDLFTKLAST